MEVPSACVPTDDAAADCAEARQGMAHLWQELGGSIFSYGHMAYMQTHEMPWAKQVVFGCILAYPGVEHHMP